MTGIASDRNTLPTFPMDERHRQVQAWLERVFGGQEVPGYEITPRTIGILYDLMLRNERGDRSTALLTKDLQQKTEEYHAEGNRLKRINEQLGVTPSTLSQSGNVSLSTLTNVAVILDAKDASNTSLMLGLSEATQEKFQVEDDRRTEQRLQAQLFNKTKAALHRLNSLHKSLTSLDEQAMVQGPELNKKSKQAGFLQSKAREYKKHAHQLNLEVAKGGVDPTLYHHNLVSLSQNLQELKSRLEPMKAKLDSYQQLPWDMSLAKVRLEEAKQELASLEAELAKHIDVMHL